MLGLLEEVVLLMFTDFFNFSIFYFHMNIFMTVRLFRILTGKYSYDKRDAWMQENYESTVER